MAPAARQIESLSNLGITTCIVDMRGIPKLKYLLAIPKIRKLAREVDVIHAHYGYCGWLAWISTRGMRNRPALVMSFMGDDLLGTPKADGSLEWPSRVQAWMNSRFAKRTDSVIVKSPEMAGKIQSGPSHVIPNGVDMNCFRPMSRLEARSRLNWDLGGRYVLFPGNPDNPRKGYALALAAVNVAREKISAPIELVALWNVAPADVALYMNASDVMLMVSLIEGSPNVVKEALACNLNVIGVPVGDVPQLLDGIAGCWLCSRDAEEIGERLAKQLTAPIECAGRDALDARGLGLDSVARQIRNIYQTACSARGGL
jgi:glycosyltransferase involved in cell wall biosynthesis